MEINFIIINLMIFLTYELLTHVTTYVKFKT
jgi:hypothetical protein